jgi:hypothetical protein
MRSTFKALAGLVLVLFTSACFVETETTLGEPDAKALDTRLVGTWYVAEKAELTLFTVAADEKEPGVYAVVFASIRPGTDNPVEFAQYRVWGTVVNGRHYLNAKRIGTGKDMPTQTVVAYDLTDNALVLRLMDTKAAVAAIEGGKLKGRVKKGTYVDEVTITSPRAEFAAFVGGPDGDKLFSQKTGALRKLPPSGN